MNRINENKLIIYPELSYLIVGVCYSVHNELGSFCKEKQYSSRLEDKFREIKLSYSKELHVGEMGNIMDFAIDNKVVLEIKAKRSLIKDDFFQVQRYLQESRLKLGLLINFRNKYLKPIRIVRIDTVNKSKFVY